MKKDTRMEKFIQDLMSKMTLTEKVGQLNQKMYGWNAYKRDGAEIKLTDLFKDEVQKFGGMGALYGYFRADPWSGATFESGITEKMAPAAANKLQKYVIENTRLGIPVLISADSPHGNMSLDGYLLPVNLAVGCTFNPKIVRSGFEICARQVRAMGAHLGLISGLDLLREPRWGRSEECYGEDPYLAGRMAQAVIRGYQGDSNDLSDKNHAGVIMKHFCAQGDCLGGNNINPVNIGERELREIHLPVMKASVQAGVCGCMAAYNEIDGIPCHANKKLLTTILRDEMGMDGIVMADGCALDRLNIMTGSCERSGALALEAGVDISLWDDAFTMLESAVENGYLAEESVDVAVKRVLELKYKLGLFENPYVDEQPATQGIYTNQQYNNALEIAQQSVVLLKNDPPILPLSKNLGKIAVIGPNADNLYNQLGDYTPPFKPENGVTVLQGIRECVSRSTQVLYEKGCGIQSLELDGMEKAVALAQHADAIILVLGGSSTRNFDVKFDKTGAAESLDASSEMDCGEGVDVADLKLGGLQEDLFFKLKQTGKPVIVVLIQGRPHAIEKIDSSADAVLCSFYPGPMGGRAIAQILFGDTSPSGRLSVTIPRSTAQLPVYYNQKDAGNGPSYVDMKKTPLYPFGYGLSYSTFHYSNLNVDRKQILRKNLESGERIAVRVDIENVGKIASYEVLQFYCKRMRASITTRLRELRGFEKVWLESGEKKTVEFFLTKDDVSVYGYDMACKVEPGIIRMFCGKDSTAELFCEIEILQ